MLSLVSVTFGAHAAYDRQMKLFAEAEIRKFREISGRNSASRHDVV